MKKALFTFLIVSLCLGISSCGKKDGKSAVESSVQIGSAAPDFALKDIEGKDTALSSFRGKVVLLEFWATWCPPCKASIPEMLELQKKYHERGFTVIGVSLDTDPDAAAKVARFSSDNRIVYPLLIADDSVPAAYQVMSIPTSFLISRDGTVIASYVGYFDGYSKKVSADIEKHL
ncbi:MAG: TlpA family protein disulfide reductase [Nitrospirae bacterium]|nr:TlpA family protein disulfide reductase [Nitrospirota bacterium]